MNVSSLFTVLGDPTRLSLVERLAQAGDQTVGELVEATGQEQSNVSHHLRELRERGLVVRERDGRHAVYALAHPRLVGLLAEARDLADHVEAVDPAACLEAGTCRRAGPG